MNTPLQKAIRMRAMHFRAVAKGKTKKTKTEKAVEKNESAMTSAIHKELRAQARTIAKQLSQRYAKIGKASKAVTDLVDEVDTDGVGIAVRDAIKGSLERVFSQAGLTALAEVDVDMTGEITQHMDVLAARYAKDRGAELVTSISSTTRDELTGLTEDAVQEGLSAQSFAATIEDSVAFSEERSLMIARTELAFAHVGGNLEGYKQSGQVEKKRWLASEDACGICDELDGMEVGIDESFSDDVDDPPAHPNCRCDIVPVLTEED